MRCVYRFLLVGLIPLAAYLGSALINLSRQYQEYTIFREMSRNVGLLEATTTLIGHLQRERGMTALFLSGGATQDQVSSLRQKTDGAVSPFGPALTAAALPAEKKAGGADLAGRLKAMRDQYGKADAQLRAKQIGDYNALIQGLIGLESAVANARTTKGFGKVLNSLLILEVAKESAGQLRANGSSLLALDKPLGNEQFSLVLRLKSEVDANLSSPALVLSPQSQNKLRALPGTAAWQECEEILKALLIKSGEGNFGVTGERFFRAMTQKIDDLGQLIEGETQLLSQRQTAEVAAFKRWFFAGIALLAAVTALVLWLTISFMRYIMRRLGELLHSMKSVAEGEGDLTMRLEAHSKDELGLIAQYFNQFVARLQTMLRQIRDNAESLAASSGQMSGVARQLASGSQATSGKASNVAAATEKMNEESESVAMGMAETSANLSSVAAATEEMSATIGEIAGNSEKARAISAAANEQAQGVAALMKQLGAAAQEIGKVTETITSISAQTNLLALNATIEAARAGAAGKGFAVVANEIKALAQQTAQATEEIKGRIAGVQTSTGAAMADVDKIAGVIQEVGGIVVTIATSIEEQTSVTRDMARNLAEASAGVAEVNRRVSQSLAVSQNIGEDIGGVHAAAQEISASSQQVQANAGDLAQLSEQLRTIVGRFKLDAAESMPEVVAAPRTAPAADGSKPFMQWSDSLSVGVIAMDEEHKRFLVLLNQMHQAMRQGKGAQVLNGILDELARYTEYHFSAEEGRLAACRYPKLEEHKALHTRFVAQVAEFRRRAATGDKAVILEVMNAVRDWLVNHIQQVDRQYGSCLRAAESGASAAAATTR